MKVNNQLDFLLRKEDNIMVDEENKELEEVDKQEDKEENKEIVNMILNWLSLRLLALFFLLLSCFY